MLLCTHPKVMPLAQGMPSPPTPEVWPPTLILIENPELTKSPVFERKISRNGI